MFDNENNINAGKNFSEGRVSIVGFGKLNQGLQPSKLRTNDFTIFANFVKFPEALGSIENRKGVQRYNGNQLSTSSIRNIFEAKLSTGYFLLGKDTAGAGVSNLKYVNYPYAGAWNSISGTEYQGWYRMSQFKNIIYICNRATGTGELGANTIWKGGTAYFEQGCMPLASPYHDTGNASHMTLVSKDLAGGVGSGGLTPNKHYFYVITYLYDGYEESGAFQVFLCTTAVSSNKQKVEIENIPVGSGRVTARKIYRSLPIDLVSTTIRTDFPENLYYVDIINDNTTTVYTDTKGDDDLGDSIPLGDFFNIKRPYYSKHNVVHKHRLIQANLEIPNSKYGAIPSGDITLTKLSGVGNMPVGTYKYRFYKAYAAHGGGERIYIIGNYTEVTETLGAGEDAFRITVNNATVNSDPWLHHIIIKRTKAGSGDFYLFPAQMNYDPSGLTGGSPESAFTKFTLAQSPYVVDTLDDADIEYGEYYCPATCIEAGEEAVNTVYRDYISISDINKGDLFDAVSLKFTDSDNNIGITGIFSEEDRLIIFKPNGIFQLITNAQDSTYWNSSKLINDIGARGQWLTPRGTTTYGHNGILQLPKGSEYVFFNTGYLNTTNTVVKIYYWNSYSQPVIISNEIYGYLNNVSELKVNGMVYDWVNNWVWILLYTNIGKRILVYDLQLAEWYVFTLHSDINLNDITITEDGMIIISGDSGYIYYYTPDQYYDKYYSGGTYNDYSVKSEIQTKTYDEYNTDLRIVKIFANAISGSVDLTLSSQINTGDLIVPLVDYNGTGLTYHRMRKTLDQICSRFNFNLNFTSDGSVNKKVILNAMQIDVKHFHQQQGGAG